jgi:hypothetical protein
VVVVVVVVVIGDGDGDGTSHLRYEPDRWVTKRTGDIGDTLRASGGGALESEDPCD